MTQHAVMRSSSVLENFSRMSLGPRIYKQSVGDRIVLHEPQRNNAINSDLPKMWKKNNSAWLPLLNSHRVVGMIEACQNLLHFMCLAQLFFH
jgi:hypothetical protein